MAKQIDSKAEKGYDASASSDALKRALAMGRIFPSYNFGERLQFDKLEGGIPFDLQSDFDLAGDQANAVDELIAGLDRSERTQMLLGITGSGKTYTMANVINNTQRPALVMAHNKTLAAQLYSEFREFFPNNAVEYFVSYYDYYQPEAYVPRSDTFIEKESMVNEQIDRMRHSATRSLLERDDVIVVASVSCIYGIGSVETYTSMTIELQKGETFELRKLLGMLTSMQYRRSSFDLARGSFSVKGDTVTVFPSHLEDRAWSFIFFGDEIEAIFEIEPLTGKKLGEMKKTKIYANSHYVAQRPTILQAIKRIGSELDFRLDQLRTQGRLLEAERLEQRTKFDLEMLEATGFCPGIENYSRFLTGRKVGEPPPTLFEYLPDNALVFVDESHVSIGQLGAMYKGDYNRKATLSEFGFRLPSCLDNRPLRFEEWDILRGPTICVSATPGKWELEQTKGVFVEQIIRPTGLLDPVCEVKPASTQVDDLMSECHKIVARGARALVTVLTKRMAEDLTEYMHDHGLQVRYMHSDIETLERVELIRDLRLGVFDIMVGINLLREGLDIPECELVAILDADKEGFLRSETSLMQTIGRAARNVNGRAILYADRITESMKRSLTTVAERRKRQQEWNEVHGIIPQTIVKTVGQMMPYGERDQHEPEAAKSSPKIAGRNNLEQAIIKTQELMQKAAENLDFEEAASLRDQLRSLLESRLEQDSASKIKTSGGEVLELRDGAGDLPDDLREFLEASSGGKIQRSAKGNVAPGAKRKPTSKSGLPGTRGRSAKGYSKP